MNECERYINRKLILAGLDDGRRGSLIIAPPPSDDTNSLLNHFLFPFNDNQSSSKVFSDWNKNFSLFLHFFLIFILCFSSCSTPSFLMIYATGERGSADFYEKNKKQNPTRNGWTKQHTIEKSCWFWSWCTAIQNNTEQKRKSRRDKAFFL